MKRLKRHQKGSMLVGASYATNDDLFRDAVGAARAYQTVLAVRRAVDLIASAVSGMGWALLRNPTPLRSNDEIVATSSDVGARHPLQRAFAQFLLDHGVSFFRAVTTDYQLFGEAVLVVSKVLGRGPLLQRLNPLGVVIHRDRGEISAFSYYWDGQTGSMINPSDVAYWHSFHPADDVRGLSIAASAMDEINIHRNLRRYIRAFFANNARPDLMIMPRGDDALSSQDVEALRRVLATNFRGTDYAGSAMVLSQAMDAEVIPPPDMTAQHAIDETITRQIFMAYGVPLAMAGDSSASAYKDGDEVLYAFYRNTVLPFASELEDYVNLRIMPFFDESGYTRMEFDRSPYERVTETDLARAQLADTLYRSGIATLNEARAKVGLPAWEADRFWSDEGGELAADEGLRRAAGVDKALELVPTEAMAEEALRGLAWRREYGRGGTAVGVARARDIANRRRLSMETVRRMKAYFDRHESDKEAEGFRPGEPGYPSAGRIAWALWGGDPGYAWSRARVSEADAAKCACGKADAAKCACEGGAGLERRLYRWEKRAALRELKDWSKAAKKGMEAALRFEPRYLAGALGRCLLDAAREGEAAYWREYHGVKKRLLAEPLRALEQAVVTAWKSLAEVEGGFTSEFRAALIEAAGAEKPSRERAQLMRILRDWGERAYLAGMEDGGYEDPELDDRARETLSQWEDEQEAYLAALLLEVADLSEAQLADKGRQWFNGSVRPLYEAGLERAARERPFLFFGTVGKRYEWKLGDAEHCPTCRYLAGMVQPMSAWYESGLLPGSSQLICGEHCKCSLVPTDKPIWGDYLNAPRARR